MAGFTSPKAGWGGHWDEEDVAEIGVGDTEKLERDEEAIVADRIEAMGNMSLADMLKDAQAGLLKDLLARVNLGIATHQEKAILRNFLRDNGMMTATPPGQAALSQPEKPVDLPDLPDYEP